MNYFIVIIGCILVYLAFGIVNALRSLIAAVNRNHIPEEKESISGRIERIDRVLWEMAELMRDDRKGGEKGTRAFDDDAIFRAIRSLKEQLADAEKDRVHFVFQDLARQIRAMPEESRHQEAIDVSQMRGFNKHFTTSSFMDLAGCKHNKVS